MPSSSSSIGALARSLSALDISDEASLPADVRATLDILRQQLQQSALSCPRTPPFTDLMDFDPLSVHAVEAPVNPQVGLL